MATVEGAPTTEDVVELLQQPATYPDLPSNIETIETHISWVFLVGRYVYKLKKLVAFDFLDFTTLEARRLACDEELRLNRRLAPEIYLDRVPITFDPEVGLELDGRGRDVDYVVKMRRLPKKRALSELITTDDLSAAVIDSLAQYLVDFYDRLPPKVLRPKEHHQHLVDHCQANLVDLLTRMEDRQAAKIRRIHGAQQRYLVLQQQLFHDRVCDGRIVEGHGDLRAEHIYMESTPSIIDCVEFSMELREVDVIDELSFLAMDCQRLGRGNVGSQIIRAYELGSGDHAPGTLIAFYKSYRACVRAKVAALRSEQTDSTVRKQCRRQAQQYVAWADFYASQLGPPAMVIVGGLMGSGKSTLASELAATLGAEWLNTDNIRRALFGTTASPADYGEGIYQSEIRQRVYETMFGLATQLLDEGRTVVLDGTFLTNDLRRTALKAARRHGAVALFVECNCHRDTALARIASRAKSKTAMSEARPDLYDQQRAERNEPDATIPYIRVDSAMSVDEQLQTVTPTLRELLFPQGSETVVG